MNRRHWLKYAFGTPAAAFALSPIQRALAQLNDDNAGDGKGRRLVLLELAGANDGLNTLVPYQSDAYRRLRPTLALKQDEVITLDERWALHRSLQAMMPLWESGELAFVHGLGYPEPNRSHFKSIALWQSGGDGRHAGTAGWVTHDIEHQMGRSIADAHGISLVADLGPFQSDTGRWLSMHSPAQFQRASATNDRRSASQASIGASHDTAVPAHVRRRFAAMESLVGSLTQKLADSPTVPALPGESLGYQLQQVHRLIRAGVDTPVFRVQLDGFDTHEDQRGTHAERLAWLAEAIAGFRRALQRDGEWDRTLVMSYSEFGRRAAENGAAGTDHGTAAPHLIAGGSIAGGLYGTAPDLDALIDEDLAHTMDYRALYQQMLAGWFGIGNNQLTAYQDERLDRLIV